MEKKRILIIDDDARNIFALSLVLKSKGYTILSAQDAVSGMNLLQSDPDIGVVLLDMMMPQMDGYQALEQLRSDAATEQLPIIAVTAQAMQGDREKCLQAGASGYISKPIDVDKLELILKQHLT